MPNTHAPSAGPNSGGQDSGDRSSGGRGSSGQHGGLQHGLAGLSAGSEAAAEGICVSGVAVSLDEGPVLRGVDIRSGAGEHLVVLGPSGCGKTTLLRALAGLVRIDDGEISLGGRPVAGPGLHVAPEQRRVGMVFQDWALFPHLSVAANVAYGLPRAQRRGSRLRAGRRRADLSERVGDLLEMVGISSLADRLPGSLSGGQQQRVALARALAPRPDVLLLDEPFSSLDTNLRSEVRNDVTALLRSLGMSAVFVTHDQDEAFVVGDQVAVLNDGMIVQQATPAEIYARPADPWVAGFVGDADLVSGEGKGDSALTSIGPVPLLAERIGPLEVLLRPEEVMLADDGDAEVTAVEYYGHDALLTVRLADGSTLRSRSGGAPRHGLGDLVRVRHSGTPAPAFERTPAKDPQ